MQDSDYDYLIAHMDIVQELGAQLKKKFAVKNGNKKSERERAK